MLYYAAVVIREVNPTAERAPARTGLAPRVFHTGRAGGGPERVTTCSSDLFFVPLAKNGRMGWIRLRERSSSCAAWSGTR